jgi:hypothetical protein
MANGDVDPYARQPQPLFGPNAFSGVQGMFGGLGRGLRRTSNALHPYSNRLMLAGMGMLGGGPKEAMRGLVAGSALDTEDADRTKLNKAIQALMDDTSGTGVMADFSDAERQYLAANPDAFGQVMAAKMKGRDPTKYGFTTVGGQLMRTDPDTGQVTPVYSDPNYHQPTPVDIFQAEQGMRKEVANEPQFQRFQKAAPIYQSMVTSASQNDQFADVNLVYGLATIMDPGSVVREGEQLIVRSAAGLTPELLGNINSLNGGGKLLPGTRQKLLREAKGRLDEYRRSTEQQMKFYQRAAEESGLDPTHIIPDLEKLGDFTAAGGTVNPDGSYTASDGTTASPVP